MTITGKPVTTLPEAESVTNNDFILVFSDGALMRAAGTLFRGAPGADATINGQNVLTLEAGDNIELSQDGGTLTLSANISGVFIFKGPATLATLPALTAANLGFTYNMTQAFTTTADFIEGAGKEYSAGADVAVCDAGNGVYKYNVLSIDLSGLVPKTRKINGHGLSADVTLTKSDVGLGNADNTSDADKPVSTAQQAALDLKVDKVSGKGLSTNDYTTAEKNAVATIGDKVDKVTGKGLSTNDYTDAEKTKVAAALTQHQDISGKQDKLPATGAANKGVYVSASGVVSPMTYELNKSVPANAVFTDTNTTYTLTQDANDGHKFTLSGSDGSSKTITIPDNNTTYTLASLGIGNVKNYDQSKAIKSITRSGTTFTYTCLDNTTGTFNQQDNNTWTAMTGATASANGAAGYVPAPPKDGYNTKYLRADGSWSVPPDTNTTYTPATAAPLMDGSAAVGTSAKYAREDHRHPTDTSRASAADLTALIDYIKTMEIYRTASGNPVVFSDGAAANVKDLRVTITPTQSGSGNPYPPGGGKNQCPVEVESAAANGVAFTVNQSDGTVTVNGTASATTVFYLNAASNRYAGNDWILSGCPAGGTVSSYCLKMFIHPGNGYGSDTGSGLTFNGIDSLKCAIVVYQGVTLSNAVFRPMIRRASDTDPTFAPYSNVRPIVGVSSATVFRAGRNLFPFETVRIELGDGAAFINFPVPLPAGTYVFSANPSSDQGVESLLCIFSDENGAEIRRYALRAGGRASAVLQTGSRRVATAALYPYVGYNRGYSATWGEIQFESGDAASGYEPFRWQTVSVALTDGAAPLTVYGGRLDVTTGTLSVTYRLVSINEFTTSGGTTPAGMYFYNCASSDLKVTTDLLCDTLRVRTDPSAEWYTDTPEIVAEVFNRRIRLYDDTSATIGQLREKYASMQIVCPLENPVTYQLTPAQLATLSGYNAVSADAGTVEITYRADPTIVWGGG